LFEFANQSFTLFLVFPACLALGLYFTYSLSCVQIRKLPESLAQIIKKGEKSDGNISRFGAVSAVLAGNFGTGNISGMAVAVATGGPGALVWMWIMAFFGAAIQYASSVLGVMYRTKTESGEYVGGPMYYLRDGLGYKKTAAAFALFTLFGAITVGNFAQINSVILPLQKLGLNPFYCSVAIGLCVGAVILGGIERIAKLASYVVPLKAALYLGTALTIIAAHYSEVFSAFQLMFQSAFTFSSVAGGALGVSILQAMKTGFDRGLFATDSGTGIVPILQSSARSEHPVKDGIATLIAPLMVMIVCTATGLVLILTGAYQVEGLQSTNMVTHAFSKGLGSDIGGHIVIVTLLLFAYTTILAWGYCGEKALTFLVGARKARFFRLGYIALVPVGSLLQVDMIWVLADLSITLMLVTNLVGIAGLSKQVQATCGPTAANPVPDVASARL